MYRGNILMLNILFLNILMVGLPTSTLVIIIDHWSICTLKPHRLLKYEHAIFLYIHIHLQKLLSVTFPDVIESAWLLLNTPLMILSPLHLRTDISCTFHWGMLHFYLRSGLDPSILNWHWTDISLWEKLDTSHAATLQYTTATDL